MAVATEARADLVAALEAVSGVTVHAVAIPVPLPPCLVVTAGSPWQEPATVGGRLHTTLRMRVMCAVRDDLLHVDQLEQITEDVVRVLPAGWAVDAVSAPASLDTGAQGAVLVSEVQITGSFTEDPTP